MFWSCKFYHPETNELLKELKLVSNADELYKQIVNIIRDNDLDVDFKRFYVNKLANSEFLKELSNDTSDNKNLKTKLREISNFIKIEKISDTSKKRSKPSENETPEEREIREKKKMYSSLYNVYLKIKLQYEKIKNDYEKIDKDTADRKSIKYKLKLEELMLESEEVLEDFESKIEDLHIEI